LFFIQERFERMPGPVLSSCGINILVPASKREGQADLL
jgi:hypothetical protein